MVLRLDTPEGEIEIGMRVKLGLSDIGELVEALDISFDIVNATNPELLRDLEVKPETFLAKLTRTRESVMEAATGAMGHDGSILLGVSDEIYSCLLGVFTMMSGVFEQTGNDKVGGVHRATIEGLERAVTRGYSAMTEPIGTIALTLDETLQLSRALAAATVVCESTEGQGPGTASGVTWVGYRVASLLNAYGEPLPPGDTIVEIKPVEFEAAMLYRGLMWLVGYIELNQQTVQGKMLGFSANRAVIDKTLAALVSIDGFDPNGPEHQASGPLGAQA